MSRVGKKFDDLEFADLIRDRLARASGKSDCFLARGICVHGHFLLQIFCGLLESEFAERKFHVHFYA